MKPEKLAHSIARAIVSSVSAANLPAGTVLEPEAEMMQRYGVSRGSLREALRILEALGFIRMKPGPGGGPVLVDVDISHFTQIATLYYQRVNATYHDLLEMRLELEPQAAELAALRRTPEDIEMLEHSLDSARGSDQTDDRAFREMGQDFHSVIGQMSGNKIISLIIQSCIDVFVGRTTGYLYPVKERTAVSDCHEKIAAAIVGGDSKAARDLMHAHMTDYVAQATKRYSGLMSEVVQW